MKKFLTFIISFVAAAVIVFVAVLLINNVLDRMSQPKKMNTFGTEFGIENNKGEMVETNEINYSKCKNKDGNFVIKVEAGISNDEGEQDESDETKVENNVDFEISFIVDYKQVPFTVNNKKYMSYAFNNSFNKKIVIDKKYFEQDISDFDIFIRPFAKDHFAENAEMWMRSADIERFSIIRNNKINSKVVKSRKMKQIKKESIVNCGMDDARKHNEINSLIDVRKNGETVADALYVKHKTSAKADVVLPSSLLTSGVIMAYLDSHQIKINNQDYIMLEDAKYNTFHISLDSNLNKGKYDLMVIGFRSPFSEAGRAKWNESDVLCSERITLYVD